MYERIASNVRKTWALIFVFIAFIALIGWLFGYFTGVGMWAVPIAVAVSIMMCWGSYFASDKIALSMSRAKPADPVRDRQLINIVEGLAIAAGIPAPRVYVVDDDAPNAFATGRNPEHAAIAVTRGLVAKMSRDELEGVVAHELSHVKNRDTLIMTIAVTLVGIIVLLADWLLRAMFWGGGDRDRGNGLGLPIAIIGLVLMLIAPLVAQVLQFAISRQREFLADADGVLLTRYPDGLIHALEKLKDDKTVVRTASKATAHLWIESPIARNASEGGRKSGAWLNRLFDTHPPLDQRIEALTSSSLGHYDPTRDRPEPPPPEVDYYAGSNPTGPPQPPQG
ncbi:MAG: heat shock protein HtpX [Actinomycetota bacterium]|nr:heat shock protein HtpX [Actinomycetota bacterium]